MYASNVKYRQKLKPLVSYRVRTDVII